MTKQQNYTLRLSLLKEKDEVLNGTEEDFKNVENAEELFRRINLIWNNFEYCVWTDEEEEN